MRKQDYKKDVILGTVGGYNFEQIKPFLTSLRKVGFAGDLVLFATGLAPETVRALREWGVKLELYSDISVPIPFKSSFDGLNWRFDSFSRALPRLVSGIPLLSAGAQTRLLAHLGRLFLNVYASRYMRYYTYLIERSGEYSNVMLADVRDVVFQRDPFDFAVGDSVCCFLEDERYTLSEPVNAGWIALVYGDDVLSQMVNAPISCSGVTIGAYSRVVGYLSVMVHHLFRLGENRRWNGMDQAVHNYVIQQGLVENLRLIRNGEGPVLTMQLMDLESLSFDLQGRIVDKNNNPFNTLHQYDRYPQQQRIGVLKDS